MELVPPANDSLVILANDAKTGALAALRLESLEAGPADIDRGASERGDAARNGGQVHLLQL